MSNYQGKIRSVILTLDCFSPVWQASCNKRSSPQTLSAANEAMFCHLGEQLARLETGRMEHMVTLVACMNLRL